MAPSAPAPGPSSNTTSRSSAKSRPSPSNSWAASYFDRLAEARGALARFLGCGADDLVFVTNATTGLNIVARSLNLQPGDEILSTDHEYGALDRTWRFLCKQDRRPLRPAAHPPAPERPPGRWSRRCGAA